MRNKRKPLGDVINSHPGGVIHLNGPEYGASYDLMENPNFSNKNPGTYEVDWHYDGLASMKFLAARGWKTVKLPVRWERLQPTFMADFDAAEQARLVEFVGICKTAGLKVILDIHNYGIYMLDNGSGTGLLRSIGSPEVPTAAFAHLWRRIAELFVDEPTVSAYNLIAEPQGEHGTLTAAVWHAASQEAVSAIREVDKTTEIHVCGFGWSSLRHWATYNPTPWIDDPENNFRYAAHHYWDECGGGEYLQSVAEEIALAEDNGFSGFPSALHARVLSEVNNFCAWLDKAGAQGIIGEIGWPTNERDWEEFGDWYLTMITRYGLSACHWATGEWVTEDTRLCLYVGNALNGEPISSLTRSSIIAEKHQGA